MNPSSPSIQPPTSASDNWQSSSSSDRTNPSSRLWHRLDAGLLWVLALPWIVLGLDSSWLFACATSTAGYIDPWVYFGFFLDLTQHIRTFKGAYFTTRLSWTVPGAIIYRLFPPLSATYVLHLAIFSASVLSLYLILKVTVSRRAALLAAVIMAFHSYFLISVGLPYIDGAANAYLLMTMAALTYAARAPRNRDWLLAVGAMAAMTIYCQLFLIVLSPVILGYYYFARKHWGFARSSDNWKPFGCGFAAVTVVFGIFNAFVNGRFFFFANSMGTAAKLMVHHNPYLDMTRGWWHHPTWLVLPTIALATALLCLKNRDCLADSPARQFTLFWLRFYVVGAAILVFFQLIGQPILQFVHYSSYFIPGAFLALGAICEIATQALTRAQSVFLGLAALGISILPLGLPLDSSPILLLRQHAILLPLALAILALISLHNAIGGSRVSADRSHVAGVASVVLLILAVATLNAATSTRTWDHVSLPNHPPSQKAALLAIVHSVRTVQELDPPGNLYFWYNTGDRLGMVFRSVASTYLWSYRLQSESFPQLGAKIPPIHRKLVILSEDADKALTEGQASLAQNGLVGDLVARRTIHEGPFSWEMVVLEVFKNDGTPLH